MTDKEKILSEIQTRKLCTMDEHMAFYSKEAEANYRLLCEIEGYIKSMQEEPLGHSVTKTSDQEEQIEQAIQHVTELLRTNPFSMEFKVVRKPKGIRIIYELTQEEMDALIERTFRRTER